MPSPSAPSVRLDGSTPRRTPTVVQPSPTTVGCPSGAPAGGDAECGSFPAAGGDWPGSISVTVAPGGGEKAKTSSGGGPKATDSKPLEKAGSSAPRAVTWTRRGNDVAASTARRTSPTRDSLSRGVST